MAFLEWIAGYVLSWLLKLMVQKVEEHAADVAEDEKRGEINDENVKKYEAAQSRADSIRAATDLLNGVPRP